MKTKGILIVVAVLMTLPCGCTKKQDDSPYSVTEASVSNLLRMTGTYNGQKIKWVYENDRTIFETPAGRFAILSDGSINKGMWCHAYNINDPNGPPSVIRLD